MRFRCLLKTAGFAFVFPVFFVCLHLISREGAGSSPFRGPPRGELDLVRIQVSEQCLESLTHNLSMCIERWETDLRDKGNILYNDDLADVSGRSSSYFTLIHIERLGEQRIQVRDGDDVQGFVALRV